MSRSRPAVISERQVCVGGRAVRLVVKRSQVARLVRFEMREGGELTVVLPRHGRLGDVDGMVQSKSRWVLSKLDALATRGLPGGSARLKEGDCVPYLGRELRIETPGPQGPGVTARMRGETLLVSTGGSRYSLETVVRAWCRFQAATVLRRKAEKYAADMGVTFSRFTIRAQKTRWGSCSQRGALSFNWRLMMAPEGVVDYVVVHEVAHLREMNHGGRFWGLVAQHCPSWREHRKWLNDHGPRLSALLNGKG